LVIAFALGTIILSGIGSRMAARDSLKEETLKSAVRVAEQVKSSEE
jgi:hypothetical protein